MLICLETHRTCDFPGGGGGQDPLPPHPPLDPHMHNAAFHRGHHCLLMQKQSSEKEHNIFWEIITCDPSIYTMDHSDITVSNIMGNFIWS